MWKKPSKKRKKLLRIVLDTNVLISGLFFGGNPEKVLELWQEKSINLLVSRSILEEYDGVMTRLHKRTKRLTPTFLEKMMRTLAEDTIFITPSHDVSLSEI